MFSSRNAAFILLSAILLCGFCLLFPSCTETARDQAGRTGTRDAAGADGGWQREFEKVLPLLGHRNWVLVTDKAFPLQTASGITYINTGDQLMPVLEHVLASIQASAHVKPQLFTDKELNYLSPRMVPGITGFRDSLLRVMKGATVQTIPHDSVFTRMQEAAGLFKIVVLKTEATVPYSSVFIRLDCDYWDEAREKELRASMQKQ